MIGAGRRRAELDALAAELAARARQSSQFPEPEREAAPEGDEAPDVETLLDDLSTLLDDGMAEARQAAAEHPVATVAAAFLLGLVLGRMWRVG
jgi:hypothetical protein